MAVALVVQDSMETTHAPFLPVAASVRGGVAELHRQLGSFSQVHLRRGTRPLFAAVTPGD